MSSSVDLNSFLVKTLHNNDYPDVRYNEFKTDLSLDL